MTPETVRISVEGEPKAQLIPIADEAYPEIEKSEG
jgi:antitoxin (DNA-binding transcriptional repressor) of toxin-antitoxin stability system